MKPGTIVLPLASMRCAPAGMVVEFAGPTAVTRPPLTTSVPRSIGARPVPSMMRALVNATVPPPAGACASDGGEARVASASSVPTASADMRRVVRFIGNLPAGRTAPPCRGYRAALYGPPHRYLIRRRLARLRREQLREVAPRNRLAVDRHERLHVES